MAWAKGEDNAAAKLTEEQVRAIRRDTRSNKAVAYEYGVTPVHIWRIRNRIKWAHVPEEKNDDRQCNS